MNTKFYLSWYPNRIPLSTNSGGTNSRLVYNTYARRMEALMIECYIRAEIDANAIVHFNTMARDKHPQGKPIETVDWVSEQYDYFIIVDFTQIQPGGTVRPVAPYAELLRLRMGGQINTKIIHLMVDRDNFCQLPDWVARKAYRQNTVDFSHIDHADLELLQNSWIPDELWAPVVNIEGYRKYVSEQRVLKNCVWNHTPTEYTLRIPTWKAVDIFKYSLYLPQPQQQRVVAYDLIYYGVPRYAFRKRRVKTIMSQQQSRTATVGFPLKGVANHVNLDKVPVSELANIVAHSKAVLLTGDEDFAHAGGLILRAHEAFNFGIPVVIDKEVDHHRLIGPHMSKLYPNVPYSYM